MHVPEWVGGGGGAGNEAIALGDVALHWPGSPLGMRLLLCI